MTFAVRVALCMEIKKDTGAKFGETTLRVRSLIVAVHTGGKIID